MKMNLDRFLYLLLTCVMIAFIYFAIVFQPASAPSMTESKDVKRDGLGGLTCQEPEFDFGRVEVLAENVHLFKVDNQSPHQVEIISVNSSCGCLVTRSQLTGKIVDQGGKLAVPVMLNAKDKSGPFQGRVDVKFRVTDDDLDPKLATKVMQFLVKGNVEAVISSDTEIIDFGFIDKPLSKRVLITRRGGQPLNQLVVDTTHPAVTAKVLSCNHDRCELEISVGGASDENNTRLNASLNLQLPDVRGRGRYLLIPIKGEFLNSNITCFPSRFVFNSNRSQQKLVIQPGNGKDQQIELSVSDSLKGMLEIQPQENSDDGKLYYLVNLIANESADSEDSVYTKGQITVSNSENSVQLPVILVGK